MKVQIELPDPPTGYIISGYQKPNKGDMILSWNNEWIVITPKMGAEYSLVAQPIKWDNKDKVSSLFNPGWIARDSCGDWYWYEFEPFLTEGSWEGGEGDLWELTLFIKKEVLPNHIPWNLSKFRVGDEE